MKCVSFADAFTFTSEQCTLCGAMLRPGGYLQHLYVVHRPFGASSEVNQLDDGTRENSGS